MCCASLAADLGYNEPTIASLLGHKTHSITSKYVHSADGVPPPPGSSATPVAGSAARWSVVRDGFTYKEAFS